MLLVWFEAGWWPVELWRRSMAGWPFEWIHWWRWPSELASVRRLHYMSWPYWLAGPENMTLTLGLRLGSEVAVLPARHLVPCIRRRRVPYREIYEFRRGIIARRWTLELVSGWFAVLVRRLMRLVRLVRLEGMLVRILV
jgi:hypothetical protein